MDRALEVGLEVAINEYVEVINNTNQEVKRDSLREIIKSTKGKIFSCEFVKKDGSVRKMVARIGVKKNLKGGSNGATIENGLVTVWDMVKGAYRMVNLATLTALKIAGTSYKVA